jgi:hypothetical protein
MHESMKMVCFGGHFPVFIHKDTREDHERITFSWNPNLLPNGPKTNCAKMVVVNDFVTNGILMFFLMEPKTIPTEMKMPNDFQVKGQGVYYIVSFQIHHGKSRFEVMTS